MKAGTAAEDFDNMLSHLKETAEQLSQRMASVETRMTNLETRTTNLETRMDAGFRDVMARLNSRFRWTIGIHFTMLVALGALILIKP